MTQPRSTHPSFSPTAPIIALLLAAGESTRMGTTKALLPWCGEPLVSYQVRQLVAGGAERVIVVTGHDTERVGAAAHAAGGAVVFNPEFRAGRAGSLRVGAAAVPDDARAVIVLSVDQPRSASLIQTVLSAHLAADSLITTPQYGDRRGHPVIFDGALLTELRSVDDATEGLRAILRRHADRRLNVAADDPSALLEFNTAAEYDAACCAWARIEHDA